MNQTLAIIVQAARVRGEYLHGSYYYGITECCGCDTKLKQWLHAHFLLNNSTCLDSIECVTYPDVDVITEIADETGQVDTDCNVTLSHSTGSSCSDLIITKVVA